MSVEAPAVALIGPQACTHVIETAQALLRDDAALELAHALYECGVVLGDRADLHEHVVVAMTESAETLVRLGRPHAALRRAEEALLRSAGVPERLRASAHQARARAHDALGDAARAREDLEHAQRLDPATPARWMLHAQMAVTEQRWDDARAGFLRAIAAAEASGDRSVLPQAHWELAHIEYAEGNRDAARERLEQARDAGRETRDLDAAAYAELDLASLAAEDGDVDSARMGFARVRALVELLPAAASSSVTLEPAAAPPGDGAGPEPLELPPPVAAPPVLRLVLSPQLGEHAQLELWSGGAQDRERRIVPFRFVVHPRTEERLRWYAEDFRARAPEPAPRIAAEVEQELARLGEALFREALGAPAAAGIVAALRQDPGRVRIEVAADAPHADGIPWELLRDPAGGVELALAARALVRTTTRMTPDAAAERSSRPMRILLVISRPRGRFDVAFRSVAGPLVRELEAHGSAIVTELLRPPTFEQLTQVLHAAQQEGRPYDLVHFDGHGVFDARRRRSYLAFQSSDGDVAHATGRLLGKELHAAGVPVLVMNACRSAHGHQEQAYGSVAREVLDCGVDGVVAMRFDVYVATAADFVANLYRALAGGAELATAVTAARRRLADPARSADLHSAQDWFVPALYESRPVQPSAPGAHAAAASAPPSHLPAPPAHGFVGRDEVFVELERVLASSAGVVLQAFAGTGKSTLSIEFARWYVATGGCPCAVHVELRPAESAGALAARLAASLGVDGGDAEADAPAALLEAVARTRPLMIWDDAEHLQPEQLALLDELLAHGGRALLLTDRPLDATGLALLKMPNMPFPEALELAEVVLAAGGAELPAETLLPLLDVAEGNPLTIVVLAREAARRSLARRDQVEQLVGELSFPAQVPAWAEPLAERLEVADAPDGVELVAQFAGYVTVPALVELRGDPDDEEGAAARTLLDRLVALGLLALVSSAGIYALHPALPTVASAVGGAQPPGRAFADAMAATGSFWAALTEAQGGGAPWLAEHDNLHLGLRLSVKNGWWETAAELLLAMQSMYAAEPGLQGWRELVLELAPRFVDVDTGEAKPGFEWAQSDFAGYLAGLAEEDGEEARAVRLREDDVTQRRQRAQASLAKDARSWSDKDVGIVRRLAAGLNNLGMTYARAHDAKAAECHAEAIRLTHAYGDWRLEALSHLNLGVFHMTVPEARDVAKADAHFEAGYQLTIGSDAGLAAKLLGERGTVHFERALEIAGDDPTSARAELGQARDMFERVLEVNGPDAVAAHQLGQIFRQLGEVDASRAWFERAIEFREASGQLMEAANTRLALADALAEAGLVGEAAGFAASALEQVAGAPEAPEWLLLAAERASAALALRAAAG